MVDVSTKIGASKKTPIVTLETNFKSLRYKDYSNGKEPLVTKDINKYSSTKNQQGWYRQYAQGTLSEITNRADDIKRITKWVTTPRGVLWEARQAALENLQTSLVAKRHGEDNSGKILSKLGKTIVDAASLTASTLAQVGASETGYRVETFLSRAYLRNGKVSSVLNSILNNFRTGADNRGGFSGVRQILGGQNISIDGKSWEENADFSLNRKYRNDPPKGASRYVVASKHEIFMNTKQSGQESVAPESVLKASNEYSKDKRYYSAEAVGENGNLVDKESQWSLKEESIHRYYDDKNLEKVEKILGPKEKTDRKTILQETVTNNQGTGENLIPFVFATYAGNSPATYFEFEATLENLSDKYTGNWNGTQYIGRPEQFYTYQGFTRSISFSFVAVAKHPEELKPLYHKLNRLASTTAPVYADNTNEYFMQGVIGEITIGDYLQHQKGFFGSISLDWEPDYMWETDKGRGGIRVPMALKVSVEFTPIHTFNVQYLDKGYFAFPYNPSDMVRPSQSPAQKAVKQEESNLRKAEASKEFNAKVPYVTESQKPDTTRWNGGKDSMMDLTPMQVRVDKDPEIVDLQNINQISSILGRKID